MTGITRERVEAMEERLRDEVLAEAGRYDGRVLVSEELDNGEVVDTWLVVQAVQTPVEVYAAFAAEGYQLSYVRIPITDEKAPKCQDCDAIAGRCVAADSDTALIFNCQMGRGRTTTAMIVAALVRSRLYPAEQAVTDLTVPPPSAASDDDRLMLQGDYAVVRSLVRVVEGGKEAKAAADRVRSYQRRKSSSLAADIARADDRLLCTHAEPARSNSGLSPRAGSRGVGWRLRILMVAEALACRLTKSVARLRFCVASNTWSGILPSSHLPRMCKTLGLAWRSHSRPGWIAALSYRASSGACYGGIPWER